MFAHAHVHYSTSVNTQLSRPLFLTNIGPAKTGPTGPVAPALFIYRTFGSINF